MQLRTLLLIAFSLVVGSAHGMFDARRFVPKRKLQRDIAEQAFQEPIRIQKTIVTFDETNENTDLTAVEVTMKKDDQEHLRTIYHQANTVSVTLPSDRRIDVAPEHFCQTVSSHCDEYESPYPVIPCDNSKLLNTGDSRMNTQDNLMQFDPAYTRQTTFPYLSVLVGRGLKQKHIDETFKELTFEGKTASEHYETLRATHKSLEKEYTELTASGFDDIDDAKLNYMVDVIAQAEKPAALSQEYESVRNLGPQHFFARTNQEKLERIQESIDFIIERENPNPYQSKPLFPSRHLSAVEHLANLEQQKTKLEQELKIETLTKRLGSLPKDISHKESNC